MCHLKAFEIKNKATFGHLRMPGFDFVHYVRKMDDCFTQNFANLAVKDNVGLHVIQMFENISFCTPCEDFL
jgi:hypothetical protein